MKLTPQQAIDRLEAFIDLSQDRLLHAIEALNARVAELSIEELSVNKQGNLLAPSASLAQARRLQKLIDAEVDRLYMSTAEEIVQSYSRIDDIIAASLAVPRPQTAVKISATISKNDLIAHRGVSSEIKSQINGALMAHISTRGARRDFLQEVKGILVGLKDKRGTNMTSHAATFVNDSIMNYHATNTLLIAESIGVNRYKYYGNTMTTTRPFCRQHVGEIKTREQWLEIGKGSWAGKSSSNVLITAGGYNCRHILQPIIE